MSFTGVTSAKSSHSSTQINHIKRQQHTTNVKIADAKDLLMASLSRFYRNPENVKNLLEIVEPSSIADINKKTNTTTDSSSSQQQKTTAVSLRLIDWFVTNYAKKYNINIDNIHVYTNYRAQLRAYTKQLFDPFRRRSRIKFVYVKGKSINTTIGQLNMFRWLIEQGILDYIKNNAAVIETDMLNSTKDQKQNNDSSDDVMSTLNDYEDEDEDEDEDESSINYDSSLVYFASSANVTSTIVPNNIDINRRVMMSNDARIVSFG